MSCFFLWICVLKMVFHILTTMTIGKCKIVKLSYIKKTTFKKQNKMWFECLVNVYYMCKQIHGKNCKTVMLSHLLLYVCTCIKKNWKCFLPKKRLHLEQIYSTNRHSQRIQWKQIAKKETLSKERLWCK